MSRDKLIQFCDSVIEWCFYTLLVVVTFSTSLVEIASSIMIFMWLLKKIIERDIKWLNLTPVKILLLYLLWTIFSCVNSQYPKESFRGIFKVVEYSLIFIIAATSLGFRARENAIKRFLYVMAANGCLICLNGFYQYFTGVGIIRHRTLISEDWMRRVSSSFVHPNDFGVYLMVLILTFTSFLMLRGGRLKERLSFLGALILSAVSLYLTKSRGAWMSFSAGLFTFGILRAKRMAALFFALLLVIFIMLPYTVQKHLTDIANFKEGTTMERIVLWTGTINMIKAHPYLGFGVNTYSRNFPQYKPPEYPDVRYTHNCFLHMASEIGIIGALFFLVFLLTVLIFCIKRFSLIQEGLRKNVVGGLIAALVGFSINSAVDTHLYSVNLAVFFYLLLGFCFSLCFYDQER